MTYRFWCGECGFKTPWGTESEAERGHTDHYATRHPGLRPGGQVETAAKAPAAEGASWVGCTTVAVLGLLFLIIVSACGR
ncbi:hypothetical protein ABT024_30285 [Streptomyces sp. NPDC002812]|uniref:hypothetical protein n=1 Tax=unclassified Streptomyces TaxID=2593676 RepID=UPI00225A5DF9|nr:hypothetical protein [Streptomyces sp. NBC_00347]MCX5129327.1 hypothetical protein [Streptomyces sp. NBC_00347]